jgi:hypothetical protein
LHVLALFADLGSLCGPWQARQAYSRRVNLGILKKFGLDIGVGCDSAVIFLGVFGVGGLQFIAATFGDFQRREELLLGGFTGLA